MLLDELKEFDLQLFADEEPEEDEEDEYSGDEEMEDEEEPQQIPQEVFDRAFNKAFGKAKGQFDRDLKKVFGTTNLSSIREAWEAGSAVARAAGVTPQEVLN